MAVRKRRQYGTGGVIHDKTNNRWVGRIEAGWTAKGTRRRITVTAKTEAECKRKLKEKQRQIAAEGLPTAGVATNTTVKTWAEQWLTMREKTVRPDTFTSDRSAVRKWIIPTIGHRKLADLTPADVRKLATAQEQAGRSLSTADRTHGVLSKLLTDAVAEGHQVPQRAREAKGTGRGVNERDAIPIPEAMAIVQAALQRPDASRWLAALLQGVRPAEALGLTWDMIDFEAETMTLAWQLKPLPYKVPRDRSSGFRIPRGYEVVHLVDAYHLVRPKTKAGWRVVPLVPWMVQALAAWRDIAPENPWGLVWPSDDGRPQDEKRDRKQWLNVAATAGVLMPDGAPPTLYEARHTCATLLLALKVDETTIKAILGHSTVLATKNYLHADQARTRAALEKLATQLGLDESPRGLLAVGDTGAVDQG